MRRLDRLTNGIEILARDLFPGRVRYLRRLKTPLGTLGLAAVASGLCGMFLHPQGFIVFFGLLAVAGLGVAWPWLSVRGLSGSLEFDRSRCREGDAIAVRLTLRNRMPWGAWGVSVRGGFGEPTGEGRDDIPLVGLAFVPGWRTIAVAVELVPGCRGVYPVRPPRVACGFPFGLWEASRPLDVAAPLLVWPRTVPVGPVPDAEGHQPSDGLATRDRAGHWGDPLGVRPYRRGDPLRRVHWGLSARHGELIVREVQSNAVPRVQIVLDTHPAAHAGAGPEGSREWAIRVAASLAEGWIGQGAEVELVFDGASVPARGGSARARAAAVLDALARLAPGGAATSRRCSTIASAGGTTADSGSSSPATSVSARRARRAGDGRGTASSCSWPGRSGATRADPRPSHGPWPPGSGSMARAGSQLACDGPGRRSCLAPEGREDASVRWTTLIMAVLATVALEQATLEPGRSRAVALAWTAGVLIAPALAASWWLARRRGSPEVGALRARLASTRDTPPENPPMPPLLKGGITQGGHPSISPPYEGGVRGGRGRDDEGGVGGGRGPGPVSRANDVDHPSVNRFKGSNPGRTPASQAPIIALLSLFALPFAGEAARLVLNGRCAMAEVTLLSALRNLGLGLAAMADRPAYARLSALVSLFLVTVASPVGGEAGMAVLAPVGGFAVAGTLWLMLVYWEGLGPGNRAGAGRASRRLPLSGAAWVLAVVGIIAAVAAVGPSRAATALAGLVPTSGGTDWSDPDARSGVGDGDNEVAASEHPESVGFTQSDVYLETDRPSLYDAFNESYGEPFKPKKVEKMVALGQQDVGDQKERPARTSRPAASSPP